MVISIDGIRQAPTWSTLQVLLKEAFNDDDGWLTRIERRDNGVSYRDLGTYALTWTPSHGDAIAVDVTYSA